VIDEKIDLVLRSLEKQAKFEDENPRDVDHSEKMLSITRNIGLFYNILLRSNGAKNILEIGTSVGYSAIWFAEAMRKNNGSIISLEQDPKKIEKAKKNFESVGLSKYVKILQGDALYTLTKLSKESMEKFDFIFIDADKERYVQYFDTSLPLLKKGGIIGADNIVYPERFNEMMKVYVNHVKNTQNVRTVTIPIDNGEEITMKLSD
jgi:predicted O-methyltransferase YrrM